MEHLSSQAGKAHIHRALHLIGGLDHLPCLHIVCRTNHGHAGDRPHQGKVLTALVGRAVLANADPGVGSTNLYIQMGIADAVAHLLKGTTGSEHGKAGRKGYQPHGRQTGGHALQLVKIIAVNGDHIKAKGLYFLINRLGAHHIFAQTVDLQAVPVNDHAQVIQVVLVGKHHGLPNLALLDLTVAQKGVHPNIILAQELGALGHTAGGADALTQRAGAHIHAGHRVHIGVTL